METAPCRFDSPFVSEHCCFVRGGGLESGHLLPMPRTQETLGVLVENVARAQEALPGYVGNPQNLLWHLEETLRLGKEIANKAGTA